jgi:DNA-binding MarR family transcriptional regulator
MSSQHVGDSDELASRLHSAVLHLLRRLAREDRATGESPARLSALSVLVFSGSRPIGHLARDERVSAPTMTRLVAGLQADGLVSRTADPDDRRTQRIAATARGREILVAGRARRVAALEALLVGVAEEDRAALASAVAIIEQRLLGDT